MAGCTVHSIHANQGNARILWAGAPAIWGSMGLSADVLDRSPDTVQIVKCTVSVIRHLACGPLGAWTRCQKSRYNP